jgi:hypothetical protein
MKYMLLLYTDPDRFYATAGRPGLERELTESGELVYAEVLADPSHTKSVWVHGDAVTTVDGPFATGRTHLSGYYIVECDTLERALEVAARVPDARYNAVEVRPLMDLSGMEM